MPLHPFPFVDTFEAYTGPTFTAFDVCDDTATVSRAGGGVRVGILVAGCQTVLIFSRVEARLLGKALKRASKPSKAGKS